MTWHNCRVTARPPKSIWISASSAKHASDVRIITPCKGAKAFNKTGCANRV